MFRLISLKLIDHAFIPAEKIQLVESKEYHSLNYLSLILGQNATGKSQILTCLSQILVYLRRKYLKQNPRWTERYRFELEVLNGNQVETITRSESGILFNDNLVSKDGKELEGILPNWIITGAYTFSDRFFFPNRRVDENIKYEYIGLRSVSNAIYTNTPFKNVIENTANLIKANKLTDLDPLFDVMGYDRKIKISIQAGTNYKFLKNKRIVELIKRIKENKNTDIETLVNSTLLNEDYLLNLVGVKAKNKKRRGDDAKSKLIKNKVALIRLFNGLAKSAEIDIIDEAGIKLKQNSFEFDWSSGKLKTTENVDFIDFFQLYQSLVTLEIISWQSLQLARGTFFDFEWASSGEIHMVGTFTGILKYIQPNSLILIDEPEISLHPNWQQAWYSIIKPISEKVPGCHFIVASHSHFIVSDLPPNESSINILKRTREGVTVKLLDKINPFAWSTEQVLLDVFDMATDRNYYLASRIQAIVEEYLKPNPDFQLIAKNKAELELIDKTHLDPKDPLIKVLNQLLKKDEEEPTY